MPNTSAESTADVGLGQVQFSQLGPHGVAALDAHGRQHNLAVAGLHVEILGGPDGLRHALGQRELVLRGDLGEHGGLRSESKDSLLYQLENPPKPEISSIHAGLRVASGPA
ncbi:MAG: hypothetical protein MUC32_04055 [Burkholderiaceae bacterium]|nr:hypothetical protein [Burkholderiaceae bacterium]